MDRTAPEARSLVQPTVSVVLPVLDEEDEIGNLLHQILGQEEPPGGFEVLVADGGSTDRTRELVAALAAQDARLRLLDNPRRRSSAGRNVGTAAARGTFVLFLDGHCRLPRPDYLVRLVELFHTSGAACLCRPQPLRQLADDAWAQAIASARHSWLGHNLGSDIYRKRNGFTDPRSAGAAFARHVVLALGGYDERFDACEDVEFNHRVAKAGLRAYVHPDLQVHYRPRRSLRGLFGQMLRYGRGRARLMARHPSVIPWPLVLITLACVLVPALALLSGWKVAGLTVGVAALAWTLAVLIESLWSGGFSTAAVRIAAAFPVLYWGLVLGFWRGLLEIPRFRAAPRSTLHPEESSPHRVAAR